MEESNLFMQNKKYLASWRKPTSIKYSASVAETAWAKRKQGLWYRAEYLFLLLYILYYIFLNKSNKC